MKVHWEPNPLYSTIELDEHDKEVLRFRIHIQQLEETLIDAGLYIEESRFDLERVRKVLHWDRWSVDEDEESALKTTIERHHKWFVTELEDGFHAGDCTCIPATCMKCVAEDALGFSTIEGLGKHMAIKIDAAFDNKNDGSVSIDEAIRRLEEYKPHAKWAGWEAHADRWKGEAAKALEWLVKYRDEHFPDQKV